MKFEELVMTHQGKTCWIVGKGPSLQYLNPSDFGRGPVIALNQAIYVVEQLDLSNPLYSLQKDGCGLTGAHHECAQREGFDWMIRPQRAVLILQETEGYSRDCLSGYEPRVLVDPVAHLGFAHPETMAIRMALALARCMGCARARILCADALVNGDTRTYNIWTGQAEHTEAGAHYLPVKNHVAKDAAGLFVSYSLPKGA